MEYQDKYLQFEYERGKREAQEFQQKVPEYPVRASGSMRRYMRTRDRYRAEANNTSLAGFQRRACQEKAAYINGWLSVWD